MGLAAVRRAGWSDPEQVLYSLRRVGQACELLPGAVCAVEGWGAEAIYDRWRAMYGSDVAIEVRGTGVTIRLATDDELRAVACAQRGQDFAPEPPRSYSFVDPGKPVAGEVLVVSQAFVEYVDHGAERRHDGTEHHGHSLSVSADVTLELLALACETAEDVMDLLAEMRIAGLGVTRWQLVSAPRRFELAPALQTRLAPLRRG